MQIIFAVLASFAVFAGSGNLAYGMATILILASIDFMFMRHADITMEKK